MIRVITVAAGLEAVTSEGIGPDSCFLTSKSRQIIKFAGVVR